MNVVATLNGDGFPIKARDYTVPTQYEGKVDYIVNRFGELTVNIFKQLWSVVKEGQMKQMSQDPDSLEDVESSLMECDPQEKLDFTEDKLFQV